MTLEHPEVAPPSTAVEIANGAFLDVEGYYTVQ